MTGARKDHEVIDLSKAGLGNFKRTRGKLIESLWILLETCVVYNRLNPSTWSRVFLLRLFGAKIGRRCRFLHAIKVKYPWNLEVGDNCWFGEEVWIYNQDKIKIHSNVNISQRAFLTTGSHQMRSTMDLAVAPIIVEEGVWISSGVVVQMGTTLGKNSVVTPNSVVHQSLLPNGIYGGNPCVFIKPRFSSGAG